MPPSGSDTLDDAQAWLRRRVRHGDYCPLCTQFAKVYKRTIHSTMARELIRCWRVVGGTDWFHVPTIVGYNGGDLLKTRYWGLMLEETEVRRDDGGRAGFWQITSEGERFVLGALRVPKYAHVYDGRCLGLSGDPVSIRDALGERFNYDDLMGR